MLGLPATTADANVILAALERRLDQVDVHPEGRTPNAEEVRLALHAAAVQLLDAEVHTELRNTAATGCAAVSNSERSRPTTQLPTPEIPATDRPDKQILRLERDALILIGSSGGWNKQSRRRLLGLAHARGLTADDVARTVARFGGARHNETVRPALAPAPAHTAIETESHQPWQHDTSNASGRVGYSDAVRDDSTHSQAGVIGYVMASLAILLAVSAGAWVMMGSPGVTGRSGADQRAEGRGAGGSSNERDPARADDAKIHDQINAQAQRAGSPTTQANNTGAGTQSGEPGLAARLRLEPERLLRWLRQSSEALDGEPGQVLADVRIGLDAQAVAWVSQPAAMRQSIDQAAMNLILACLDREWLRDEVLDHVLGLLAIPTGEADSAIEHDAIPSAAWTAAMVNRMAQRPGMNASMAIRLSAALDDAKVGGFRAGEGTESARMLELIASSLVEQRLGPGGNRDAYERRAWATWGMTLAAVSEGDIAARDRTIQRVLTETLGRIATRADADRLSVAFTELVPLMDWSSSGTARAWLLDVLTAPAVRSPAARALTVVLTTTSTQVSIGPTMVLPLAASEDDRDRLRDQYAAAWSLTRSAEDSEYITMWRLAVEAHFASTVDGSLGAQISDDSVTIITQFAVDLADAVASARLSRIAALHWQGDSGEARDELQQWTAAADTLTAVATNTRAAGLQSSLSDGRFALEYLQAGQAGRVAEQLAVLEQLSQRNAGLGRADADVLLIAAGFGETRDVRDAAVRLVLSRRDDPAVLDAALELLPMVPRTRFAQRWLSQLAVTGELSLTDPEWKRPVRAGLVQRLLDQVSGVTEFDVIDELSEHLARAYALGPQPDEAASVDRIAALARARSERWITRAEQGRGAGAGGPIARAVRAKSRSRTTIASGPLQQFVVEQRANVEALGAMVEAERVGAGTRARLLLQELEVDLSAADTVSQQIVLIERVRLRFWRLLLHGDDI